jgi:hypothetical protein
MNELKKLPDYDLLLIVTLSLLMIAVKLTLRLIMTSKFSTFIVASFLSMLTQVVFASPGLVQCCSVRIKNDDIVHCKENDTLSESTAYAPVTDLKISSASTALFLSG